VSVNQKSRKGPKNSSDAACAGAVCANRLKELREYFLWR